MGRGRPTSVPRASHVGRPRTDLDPGRDVRPGAVSPSVQDEGPACAGPSLAASVLPAASSRVLRVTLVRLVVPADHRGRWPERDRDACRRGGAPRPQQRPGGGGAGGGGSPRQAGGGGWPMAGHKHRHRKNKQTQKKKRKEGRQGRSTGVAAHTGRRARQGDTDTPGGARRLGGCRRQAAHAWAARQVEAGRGHMPDSAAGDLGGECLQQDGGQRGHPGRMDSHTASKFQQPRPRQGTEVVHAAQPWIERTRPVGVEPVGRRSRWGQQQAAGRATWWLAGRRTAGEAHHGGRSPTPLLTIAGARPDGQHCIQRPATTATARTRNTRSSGSAQAEDGGGNDEPRRAEDGGPAGDGGLGVGPRRWTPGARRTWTQQRDSSGRAWHPRPRVGRACSGGRRGRRGGPGRRWTPSAHDPPATCPWPRNHRGLNRGSVIIKHDSGTGVKMG